MLGSAPTPDHLDSDCNLKRRLDLLSLQNSIEFKIGWNEEKAQWAIQYSDGKLETYSQEGCILSRKIDNGETRN